MSQWAQSTLKVIKQCISFQADLLTSYITLNRKEVPFFPLKAVAFHVYNEPSKHSIWSHSRVRRWEGKGEAEKEEAVTKNLVSVSGKVSKEIKSIQLSSDTSLSLSPPRNKNPKTKQGKTQQTKKTQNSPGGKKTPKNKQTEKV